MANSIDKIFVREQFDEIKDDFNKRAKVGEHHSKIFWNNRLRLLGVIFEL